MSLYHELLSELGLDATPSSHESPYTRAAPVQDWRRVLASWPQHEIEDWEERAAIREYDGEQDRQTAEFEAFKECLARRIEHCPERRNMR